MAEDGPGDEDSSDSEEEEEDAEESAEEKQEDEDGEDSGEDEEMEEEPAELSDKVGGMGPEPVAFVRTEEFGVRMHPVVNVFISFSYSSEILGHLDGMPEM